MRIIRALLVGLAAGSLTVGTATVSHAADWQRPWIQHSTLGEKLKTHYAQSPFARDNGDGGGDENIVDSYDIGNECKGGTFGYCTQNVAFNPTIIGDISIPIGGSGVNGSSGGSTGTSGSSGSSGTSGSSGSSGSSGASGTGSSGS